MYSAAEQQDFRRIMVIAAIMYVTITGQQFCMGSVRAERQVVLYKVNNGKN